MQLEKVDQNKESFITLIKIRLNFLFPDLFQHFRIYLVVFALKFFYSWAWLRGGAKTFVLWNQKSYNHNPNIKPEIFQI